ncbi:tRNA (adenosine(37)-N6)-dimethylallyltransferase MiaA [Wolbachia pipientis]|uniref:tRNA dimethylallyltransferase n=1 Tax=Wolbachia pipientis TaxID=955 RepID=A0A6H2NTF8_WOLPI|nr:tRNA (adenosine(37)-N6)-dimethylallyltransferase MiaA [Wolbachia endosymbiont of Aedes albopictus]TVS87371.1 tRNA (adenosine(37)-N6)-dimethylallyltransferase MiaA [Wolbachia pipientis]TVS97850.1 tRNA (adenosine(37)-N6)-dimethylallyltransferase MiaA [Wolbachia pipientis]UVW83818.1 tRNA (adenosine(37)-N6)-dimethylallyltransferase MiaA [Wolbachia endosymbiont of Aedes albopictus]
MKNNIVIITGITASGKSELCDNLIEKYNNISIINCDSKQVYEEIPIITAQPLKQEVFYKLYGYVSAKENYSVGLWLEDLKKEINNALENSQIPVITGGSGLYISSLIKGLSSMPQISQKVKKNVSELRKNLSKEEFYKLVLSKDSKVQDKICINDSHRLSRALEVITETGKTIFAWQENRQPPLFDNFKIHTILPKREDVYQKINSRFIKMIENGAIDEVKKLLSMNLAPHLPAMKAHGVPEIVKYLKGEITLDEAIQVAQTNTRHYAKRQYTWFKNQFPSSEVIDCANELTALEIF